MKKVCFVVLHFKDEEATRNCINSLINNILYENIEIVVVDNGSQDGSGESLKKYFKSNNKIHIIINEVNTGYARGNNVGYRFAKEELKTDYIIILNNDTLINQTSFVEEIIKIYQEKSYFVLGPDIYSLSNKIHQSPIRIQPLSSEQLVSLLKIWREFEKNEIRNKFKFWIKDLIGVKLIKDYRKLKNFKKINNDEHLLYKTEKENIVLHGACIVFSPLYVSEENFAFFPETFLYLEEDILTYFCIKKNMKIIYSPRIQVLHYEDLSTNQIVKKEYDKELFKIKHQRHSAEVFLNLMSPNVYKKGN